MILNLPKKLAGIKVVSDEEYNDVIPEEMNAAKLNKVHYQVFGAETTDIYLSRDVFSAKSILLTDFSTNGFFWGQIEQEAVNQCLINKNSKRSNFDDKFI